MTTLKTLCEFYLHIKSIFLYWPFLASQLKDTVLPSAKDDVFVLCLEVTKVSCNVCAVNRSRKLSFVTKSICGEFCQE